MNKMLGGAVVALFGAAWVKVYGDYKYAKGLCDADKFYKPIIEAEHKVIKDLCERLKKKEEEA